MLNSLFHGLQMQMMRCGFSALPGHYVVFFGNSFTLTVPQFIHVYKWVPEVRRLLSLSSLQVSSTIFSSTIKSAELPPPSLSSFLFISVQLMSVSLISAKIFQNWSTPSIALFVKNQSGDLSQSET